MSTPCTKDTEIELIKNNSKYMTDKIDGISDKLDKLIDQIETKYAGKWVEKVLIFIWSIVGGSLISAIMYLVIKQ